MDYGTVLSKSFCALFLKRKEHSKTHVTMMLGVTRDLDKQILV